MNLVRSGPQHIMISSSNPELTSRLLENLIETVVTLENDNLLSFEDRYHDLSKKADDNMCVLHITTQMKSPLHIADLTHIILSGNDVDQTLVTLFNNKEMLSIDHVRMGPKMIIMKVAGDIEQIIDLIKDEFSGTDATIDDLYQTYAHGTLIVFTKASLNSPVSYVDMHHRLIYSTVPFRKILRDLRTKNLKYINEGINNELWNELNIKIYDSYGHYELHYERLMFVLEKLNYGLVLGESWGKDAALAFHSVGVYNVHFFTYYDPIVIKEILVGLETLDDGTRIVDYDLFKRRKKYHWDDLRSHELKTREQINAYYRKKLNELLSEEDNEVLDEYNRKILFSKGLQT